MRCRKQPPFKIPEKIANVWDVLLDYELWERIKLAKMDSKTSYSWVVRYCVFTLIKKINAQGGSFATDIHSKPQCSRQDGHRLQLCLYGNDEKILRIAAISLNKSISELIRLALKLYLHRFIKKCLNARKFLCLKAIKKVKRLEFSNERIQKLYLPGEILYQFYRPDSIYIR